MSRTYSEPESRASVTMPRAPTLWGLSPVELHDRYWAARGVCVVRPGEEKQIPAGAELYMLTDARTMVLFHLGRAVKTLSWVEPMVTLVRVRGQRDVKYREQVVTGEDGRFVSFHRSYGKSMAQRARVALTTNRSVAQMWQSCGEARSPWKQLRKATRLARRERATVTGQSYRRRDPQEQERFVRDLIEQWKDPSVCLPQLHQVAPRIWAWPGVKLDSSVRFVGAAWIGAGRAIESDSSVLGPAALWDDPAYCPSVGEIEYAPLERAPRLTFSQVRDNVIRPGKKRPIYRASKRLFDIVFSLLALIITLPFYLLIMFLIWWEDGFPLFFVHWRETVGGKEFPCLKFRTMKNNAEQIKKELQQSNRADGPQFYMPGDPRITKIGARLRRCNLDELPQFINVLLGHMSIIGPRPSPRKENQCCPAWREARLSVRPGITGLWQIMRTRQPGLDFQEWIRYDLEYIEHGGWKMDLWIAFKTARVLFWD